MVINLANLKRKEIIIIPKITPIKKIIMIIMMMEKMNMQKNRNNDSLYKYIFILILYTEN